jgi:hypothetical protein
MKRRENEKMMRRSTLTLLLREGNFEQGWSCVAGWLRASGMVPSSLSQALRTTVQSPVARWRSKRKRIFG